MSLTVRILTGKLNKIVPATDVKLFSLQFFGTGDGKIGIKSFSTSGRLIGAWGQLLCCKMKKELASPNRLLSAAMKWMSYFRDDNLPCRPQITNAFVIGMQLPVFI